MAYLNNHNTQREEEDSSLHHIYKTLVYINMFCFGVLRVLPFLAVLKLVTHELREDNYESKSLKVVLTRELCFTYKTITLNLYPFLVKKDIFLLLFGVEEVQT